jgi:hypothetical protein
MQLLHNCVVCCTTSHRLPVKILNRVLVENWEGGMVLTAACRHKGSKIRKNIQMAEHYIWQFSGMKRSFICLWDVTLYHMNPHDMHCFTLHQLLFKRHDSVCGPMTYTVCPLSNEAAFIMETWMNILKSFYDIFFNMIPPPQLHTVLRLFIQVLENALEFLQWNPCQ